MNKDETYDMYFSKRDTLKIIKDYYENEEGIKCDIEYEPYVTSVPDGWGFYDNIARINLIIISKIKSGETDIKMERKIKYKDINLKEIFRPFLEKLGYEPCGGYLYLDTKGENDDDVVFKGVNLTIKKKNKEKQLIKTKDV